MNLKGRNTAELICEIVLNNDLIDQIFFHTYPNAPQLQDRINFDSVEKVHYDNALKLRKKFNVPFWDALMLSYYDKNEFSEKILKNVLNNHPKRKLESIVKNTHLGETLVRLSSTVENYAINSKIITHDGSKRHFILLDFHIPESKKNQAVVESILQIIKSGSGYLLQSGKSYHFFGDTLISSITLTKFLGKCLFFSPIIDKSWIAHQLVERSCSIRFSKKYDLFPTVIKRIN